MFTGIVEHLGEVRAQHRHDDGVRLEVACGPVAADATLGDSIAVNGICLTVSGLDGEVAAFDVSGESLERTTLASWRGGRRVNLERALPVGGRLGGHIVGGHVDGVGRLDRRRRQGAHEVLSFLLPEDDRVKVVEKGSIAIDGISLTTWDCRGRRFSVAVVPHTLDHTTLGALRPGSPVNMEQDVIGRWVERLLGGG